MAAVVAIVAGGKGNFDAYWEQQDRVDLGIILLLSDLWYVGSCGEDTVAFGEWNLSAPQKEIPQLRLCTTMVCDQFKSTETKQTMSPKQQVSDCKHIFRSRIMGIARDRKETILIISGCALKCI